MKQLKTFTNMIELLEEGKVQVRIDRTREESEELLESLISSGEWKIINIDQAPNIHNLPTDFNFQNSLET